MYFKLTLNILKRKRIPKEYFKVAINAQIISEKGSGGVEQVLIGLVNALGKLDGPEKYIIITSWQDPDWIRPYIGPNQIVVPITKPKDKKIIITGRKLLGPARPFVNKLLQSITLINKNNNFSIPVSDGFYEQLGADVIHFPYQYFVQTSLPSIFNPHDLQHLHYPQFFSQSAIEWREKIYPAGCIHSTIVAVASQWVKQDIINHYHIDPNKIQVIPWAPPTQAFQPPSQEIISKIKSKYNLNKAFAFYPAMNWPHKNHLRLLDALAYLRDNENLIINMVCTGDKTSDFFAKIEERISQLDLNDQVKFLGVIPNSDLRAMYRLSQFVVVPTLFEAASSPVFEAWQEDIPVACSRVTSLPEQVGTAALLFDPNSTLDIAEALKQMSTDQKLRCELKRRGEIRLKNFSWEKTAKAYRAVYRLAAGRTLSDEDRKLLSLDWMRNPENALEEIRW